MAARPVVVEVGGHRLHLTNLDKVLFPSSGTTKAEVLDYYRQVAPFLLAHLAGRPVTFLRAPDGVEEECFYEKRRPRDAPSWLGTITVERRSNPIDAPAIDTLAALVWAANRAVIELHVPQWRIDADGRPGASDLLVLDLDPGPPASLVECCQVALLAREPLRGDELAPLPKVSGSSGLQLYARRPAGQLDEDPSAYAHGLARRLERAHPGLVVSSMTKSVRTGKVLIDWSQNSRSKTTIAPYSLRARPLPRVSCPVTWEEVEATARGAPAQDLAFGPEEVLARLEDQGDLFAPLLPTKLRAAG